MNRLGLAIATVGFISLRLPAPATTVGSLAVLAAHLAWTGATGRGAGWPAAVLLALFLPVSIWASHCGERAYGRDAGPIVVDEVVGMALSLLFLPAGAGPALLAFVLFRVFDIVKPFPAGRAQNLPGGWGVVADDVMAGLYANLAARLVLRLAG